MKISKEARRTLITMREQGADWEVIAKKLADMGERNSKGNPFPSQQLCAWSLKKRWVKRAQSYNGRKKKPVQLSLPLMHSATQILPPPPPARVQVKEVETKEPDQKLKILEDIMSSNLEQQSKMTLIKMVAVSNFMQRT